MDTFRLTITPAAPAATPWQADTLWGHLVWALARRRGDAAVRAFFDRYRAGAPPLVLSDGFPEGRLPRPMLPAPPPPAAGKTEAILAARRGKAGKGSLLLVESFLRLCRGEAPEGEEAAPVATRGVVAFRNSIDRRTGTAGGDGGELFTIEEFHTGAVQVYLRVEPDDLALLEELLAGLKVEGYGRRRTAGYGAIAALRLEPWTAFDPPAGANGFVSLSRFVPAADDPVDGGWRTDVKFGRVGGETDRPFKRPLVMLTAGSWFRTAGTPRAWYGRLVEGITPAHPEVVHYGLAFAVPVALPATVGPALGGLVR